MFPVADEFDLYVSATGPEPGRMATLTRLKELHALDDARARAFLSGERVLLGPSLTDSRAKTMATGLRTLGLRIDIEAKSKSLAMVEIDSFAKDEPAKLIAPTNDFFDINAGLVGLDGTEEPVPLKPTPQAAAPLLDGLISANLGLGDLDEPPTKVRGTAMPPGPPPPAPPAPPIATPPPAPPIAARGVAPAAPVNAFRPTRDSGNIDIALDVVPPDPMLSQPAAKNKDVVEAPRCPRHGVARIGGRCPGCDAEEAVVQGKLFQGRLHDKLPVRVGIGLAGGLVVGFLLTSPMARRAERHVETLREEAGREAARPLEEAQAHARQLLEQADEEAQSSFFRTLAIWGVITAAITGVWYKLT